MTVTAISIAIGVLTFALLMSLVFPKIEKNKKVNIYYSVLASICIGCFVFLTMFKYNNYNNRFLSDFTDYKDIEILDILYGENFNSNSYKFILIYDDETELKGYLSYDLPEKFQKFECSFFLTDIFGETVYSSGFSDDVKEYHKLQEIFIIKNLDKFKKFSKDNNEEFKYLDSNF